MSEIAGHAMPYKLLNIGLDMRFTYCCIYELKTASISKLFDLCDKSANRATQNATTVLAVAMLLQR